MKKEKLSEYSLITRKIRKTKTGLALLVSLFRGDGDEPFLMNLKFAGKDLCKELLKQKRRIFVRAYCIGNKIDYLKSITLLKYEKSKNGKVNIVRETYPLERTEKEGVLK